MQKEADNLDFELDETDIAFDPVPAKREGLSSKRFKELSSMEEQGADPLMVEKEMKAV